MIVYYKTAQIILMVMMIICMLYMLLIKAGYCTNFINHPCQIQTAAKVKVFSCFALLLPLTKSAAAK
jgi:hypothetical protein